MAATSVWATLPTIERDRLLVIYQSRNMERLIWESLSKGIKINTLIRRLQEYQADKPIIKADDRPNWLNMPLSLAIKDCVFISDLEIPDQHNELLDLAKQIGKIYEINTLIYGGDMLSEDQPGLATHPITWEYERPTFENNIATLRELDKAFSEQFPSRYMMEGNHDRRVSKASQGTIWYGNFMSGIEGLTCTRFPFIWCNTGTDRGLIKFTHQVKAGDNAIPIGRRLLAKSNIKSHIVMAHTHTGIRGWSPDGMYEIICNGCCRSIANTQYINITDDTYSTWQQGFLLVKNGYFYLMNLYGTDWKRILKGDLI